MAAGKRAVGIMIEAELQKMEPVMEDIGKRDCDSDSDLADILEEPFSELQACARAVQDQPTFSEPTASIMAEALERMEPALDEIASCDRDRYCDYHNVLGKTIPQLKLYIKMLSR